ncbi:YIP1 family protein [Rheinheimera sp. MMS21-TC3]|uniref:YIP1 family protein n=1 Tax=Rheinheimera sp. MMS21-TC3 TaxID=3072790 RepID=UPI0028C4AD89|nr:YIP1 family protein [Rheinheimera sp. MMS21-TC3]WNO59735.1 YIP1 family protein [Rheinheimera sp. MMS21-TC3]
MSKNLIQGIADLYVAPKSLFNTLAEKKGWSVIVFFLLLLVNTGVMYAFYAGMSPMWLVEQQISAIAHTLSPAEIETTRAAMGHMADKTKYIVAASVLVMTPIMLAIIAVYLMLVGNPGKKRPYGDWYAMTVWVSLPGLLNVLGLAVLILLSSTPDMPINTPNYLSVNQLFLQLGPQDAWFSWAESLNLIYLWTTALTAVGLKCWSGYSTIKASLLAVAPLLIIYGLWALFI